LKCVDSAQPLAIGGGIHNTAENKACPAFSAKPVLGLDPGMGTGSHQENASKQKF
jgi:hypothetical protein